MKFNDGDWLLREGVTARYATEALDARTSAEGCSVAVLTRRVQHRGSHLNTPTITVELSSPAPDVVSVRASHHAPTTPPSVAFALEHSDVDVDVAWDGDRLRLTSGQLTAEANL